MLNRKKGIEKFPLVLILLVLPFLVMPATVLFGGESGKKIEGAASAKADFVLTVKEGLISLSAKDSSLKEIIENIGDAMRIEVIGNISDEEKISVDFDNLSLKDALGKLSTNYGYLTDSEKEGKKNHGNNITKIVILPKGNEAALAGSTVREPEPYKFEFDPKKFLDKED